MISSTAVATSTIMNCKVELNVIIYTSYNECSNLVGTLVHIIFFTNPSIMQGPNQSCTYYYIQKRVSNYISKDGTKYAITIVVLIICYNNKSEY